MRKRSVAVSLILVFVALAGMAFPFYATETEVGAETCTTGAPEGSEAIVSGWSWWPIGIRCVLIERDGSRREDVVPPWRGDPWADEEP